MVALKPAHSEWVPLEERRGPQSAASLWELFLASPAHAMRSKSTRKNMERTAELCTQLKLAALPGPGDVSLWLSRVRELPGKKKGSKMSGNTVTLHRDNLHKLFSWARASGKGWTSELGNPVDPDLCTFQRGRALRHALRNIDDVWPFLVATAGEGDGPDVVRRRAFLCVLRYLGCRISEALSVKPENVEVDEAGVWWVRLVGQRNAEGWELLPPKSVRARRRLPCRPELRDALRAVLKLGRTVTVKSGHGGHQAREVDWLFPYRAHELEAMMLQLRGVCPDDFSFGNAWHVFRHTAACEMERRGVPLERVSEWLGHVSVANTMTYLRSISGSRVDADLLTYFAEENRGRGHRAASPAVASKTRGDVAPPGAALAAESEGTGPPKNYGGGKRVSAPHRPSHPRVSKNRL